MKLICFNIGIKIDNSKQVAEFIKSRNPDFVAFQEVVRHLEEKVFDRYKSKAHIEAVIGKNMPYHFFGPQWITDAMRKNGKTHRDFNGYVEQGNEVISTYPITNATNEFFHKEYSLAIDWTNFRTEDHPRCVQIVELDVKGKKLQILNLHGIWSQDKLDSERSLKQCKFVLEAAKRKDIPTIITGDFNLLPTTKSMQIISKEFRSLIDECKIISTVPKYDHGTEPKKGDYVVDFIFVNDKIKVNNFEVIETDISDHLPLILDFEIRG